MAEHHDRAQREHMRFAGGTVYCPRAEGRVNLGHAHRFGDEFVCPGCNVRIEATDYFKANPRRRNVQITALRAAGEGDT